jgi:mannitol PTS system EIIA component
MTEQVLEPSRIRLGGHADNRDGAIREVGQMLVDSGAVSAAYVDAMFAREATVSTFMGNGLAIPHGTDEAKDEIRRSALAVIRYDEPIDWNGQPVRFVIGIAGRNGEHIGILSAIAIAFSDEDQVQQLLGASTPEQLIDLLGEVNAA